MTVRLQRPRKPQRLRRRRAWTRLEQVRKRLQLLDGEVVLARTFFEPRTRHQVSLTLEWSPQTLTLSAEEDRPLRAPLAPRRSGERRLRLVSMRSPCKVLRLAIERRAPAAGDALPDEDRALALEDIQRLLDQEQWREAREMLVSRAPEPRSRRPVHIVTLSSFCSPCQRGGTSQPLPARHPARKVVC